MHYFDLEQLAIAVTGICENSNSQEIEDAILKRFEIDVNAFSEVVEALIPFTVPVKAGISGNAFQGFVDVKTNHFIVKKPFVVS